MSKYVILVKLTLNITLKLKCQCQPRTFNTHKVFKLVVRCHDNIFSKPVHFGKNHLRHNKQRNSSLKIVNQHLLGVVNLCLPYSLMGRYILLKLPKNQLYWSWGKKIINRKVLYIYIPSLRGCNSIGMRTRQNAK